MQEVYLFNVLTYLQIASRDIYHDFTTQNWSIVLSFEVTYEPFFKLSKDDVIANPEFQNPGFYW